MKRKLSFLIAAIMVLSLLPAMSVSAATDNTILRAGGTVAKDANWSSTSSRGVAAPIPVLQISKKGTGGVFNDWSGGGTIELSLTNAKWMIDDGMYDGNGMAAPNVGRLGESMTVASATKTATYDSTLFGSNGEAVPGYASDQLAGYVMTQINKTKAQLTFTAAQGAASLPAEVDSIYIPLLVELTGEGDARIEISKASGDLAISTGNSYAFARGSAGATNSYFEDDEKTFSNWIDLDDLVIEETRVGSIDTGKAGGWIKLTAPAGFKFANGATGSVATTAGAQGFIGDSSKERITFEAFPGLSGLQNATSGATQSVAAFYGKNDTDTGVLDIQIGNSGHAVGTSSGTPGYIVIGGLRLQRTESVAKTKTGPVSIKVAVPGGTSQTIQAAIFAGRNVDLIIEDAELPEIVNGKWKNDADSDEALCLTATIKESALETWNEHADTVLKLNKGVKFRAVQVDDSSGWSGASWEDDVIELGNEYDGTGDNNFTTGVAIGTFGTDDNIILNPETLTLRPDVAANRITRDNDSTISVTLKIWVTIEPGFTGDIVLSTDEDNESFGAKLEGVIAKAINPFEITTSSTPIDLGYMNLPVADIIIKENVAGAFDVEDEGNTNGSAGDATNATTQGPANMFDVEREDAFYVFRIAGYNFTNNDMGNLFKSAGDYEILEGDVLVEDYDVVDGRLQLKIKRSSDEPSTIKLSGLTIDTNRFIAEGKLSLEIGGYAAANWRDNTGTPKDSTSFSKGWVEVLPDYINVITAAPNKGTMVTTVVAVTVGADKIIADNKEIPVDVPAFLETWTDGNGYTMVPVRAVAEAMGTNNFQINWDAVDKTVTIKDIVRGTVSQFTVGSNKVLSGGASVRFDGPSCMIKDGRSFLPFRALGELVLDVPVEWDADTRTAWYNRYGKAAPAAAAE